MKIGAMQQHISPWVAAPRVMPCGWDFQKSQNTFPANIWETRFAKGELGQSFEAQRSHITPPPPTPPALSQEIIAINYQNTKAQSYPHLGDSHLREPK